MNFYYFFSWRAIESHRLKINVGMGEWEGTIGARPTHSGNMHECGSEMNLLEE